MCNLMEQFKHYFDVSESYYKTFILKFIFEVMFICDIVTTITKLVLQKKERIMPIGRFINAFHQYIAPYNQVVYLKTANKSL